MPVILLVTITILMPVNIKFLSLGSLSCIKGILLVVSPQISMLRNKIKYWAANFKDKETKAQSLK